MDLDSSSESNKIPLTSSAVKDYCSKSLNLAQIPGKFKPQAIITFSAGGLFTTGYYMQVGLPKLPLLSLPWSRNDKKNFDSSLGFFLARVKRLVIIDDIVDSGKTIEALLKELESYEAYNTRIKVLAPIIRQGAVFTTKLNFSVHCGMMQCDRSWFVFPWECNAGQLS